MSAEATRGQDSKSKSRLKIPTSISNTGVSVTPSRSPVKLSRYPAVPARKTKINSPTPFPASVTSKPLTKESPTTSSNRLVTVIFGPYKPSERNAELETSDTSGPIQAKVKVKESSKPELGKL